MKISYDKTAGAIYFNILENTKIFDTQEIREDLIIDLDENNNIVGIEILTTLDPNLEEKIKNISVHLT